jgi:hypothetical protein
MLSKPVPTPTRILEEKSAGRTPKRPARLASVPETFPLRRSRRREPVLVLGSAGSTLRAAILSDGKDGIRIESGVEVPMGGDVTETVANAVSHLNEETRPGSAVVALTTVRPFVLELPISASQWADYPTMQDAIATRLREQSEFEQPIPYDEWRFGWVPLETPVSAEGAAVYPWLASIVPDSVFRSWCGALSSARLELECLLPLHGASAGLLAPDSSAVVIEARKDTLCVAVVQPGGLASVQTRPIPPTAMTVQDLWELLGPADVREAWYFGAPDGTTTAEEFAAELGVGLRKPALKPATGQSRFAFAWTDLAGAARSGRRLSGAPVAAPIESTDTERSFWSRMRQWWAG